MAEPTLPELLRVAFDTVREIDGEDPVSLAWPDDIDGQARCIRHLSDMATNPRWPYQPVEEVCSLSRIVQAAWR